MSPSGKPGRSTQRGIALGALAVAAVLGALLWGRTAPVPPEPPPPSPGPAAGSDAAREPAARAPLVPRPLAPASPPAAAADAPVDPPAPPPDPTTDWLDEEGQPTRALVRDALVSALAHQDPSLALSSEELDAAADALWRLREARLELAELSELGDDPALAARRAELVEAIGRATADFEYHVEMSPAELGAGGAEADGFDAPPPVVE